MSSLSSVFQPTSMDLVVVPAISLNPKKAKKKLKKAARTNDQVDAPQLPVNDPTFSAGGVASQAVWPASFDFSSTSKLPVQSSHDSTQVTKAAARPARKTRATPQVVAKTPVQEKPLIQASCAITAKSAAAVDAAGQGKRSWFDITEDDTDDFLFPAAACVA
jgi:hypothetical protein